LLVPSVLTPVAGEIVQLAATVALLRRACPWDREQTHASLVRHLLEETYEAMEALEALGEDAAEASAEAVAHAEEELGDLLCQVVFHATLGAEEGLFTLGDIARTLDQKLVERHPHVFGDVVANTASDVVENWERSKDRSKRRSFLLQGIPASTPALARANKTERKLKSAALGWDRTGESLEGLVARLGSVTTAPDEVEAGDLLLLLARRLASDGIDGETVLRHALDRLGRRIEEMEQAASATGQSLEAWAASDPGRAVALLGRR
ncbi:MAG: MazG nucleotide pyrophosphohydrolase domain-containing protein, partial [Acidimicrobiales bacterium]